MLQTLRSSQSDNRPLVKFAHMPKPFTRQFEEGAMEHEEQYDFHDPNVFCSPQQIATSGLTLQSWNYQVDAPLQLDPYAVASKPIPGFQAPPQVSQWKPPRVEEEPGVQAQTKDFTASSQWDAVDVNCNTETDFVNNQAIVDIDPSNWLIPDINGVSGTPDISNWSAIRLASWNSPNALSEPSDAEGSFTFSTDFDQTSPPPLLFDTGTTPYPELEEAVSPEDTVRPGDLGLPNEAAHDQYNDGQLGADDYTVRNQDFPGSSVYSRRFNPSSPLPLELLNGPVPGRYPNGQRPLPYFDGQAYSNVQNPVSYSNGRIPALYPQGQFTASYPNGNIPGPYSSDQIPVSSVEDEFWVPQGPNSFNQSTSPPANHYPTHSRQTTSSPATVYPNYSPPQPNPYPNLPPQHHNSTTPPLQQRRPQRLPSTQPTYRTLDNARLSQDALLLEGKAAGLTYKEIKNRMNTPIAESTLRGRYRSLTKERKDRVRKPQWTHTDIQLLTTIVNNELERVDDASYRALSRAQKLNKLSWKRVADYIARNGGSYRFGNSTCKKKWGEIEESRGGGVRCEIECRVGCCWLCVCWYSCCVSITFLCEGWLCRDLKLLFYYSSV